MTDQFFTNKTNKWYCRRCEDITEHKHWHDAAHGIEGTHMAGSERYVCKTCNLTTHVHDEGANHFIFTLDTK